MVLHEGRLPGGTRYLETHEFTCNDAARPGATFGCISLWALRVLGVSGPALYAKGRGQLASETAHSALAVLIPLEVDEDLFQLRHGAVELRLELIHGPRNSASPNR
jgi:hypothetical protein